MNSIWNKDSDTTKIVSQDRFFVLETYGRSPSSMYRVHFDAIRWISSAWNNVREETIFKCFRRAGFASPQTDLQELEDSTSESDLVSALPEALQFEVASEDILENEANIFVHENIVSTAEGILEDIMMGRVQRRK